MESGYTALTGANNTSSTHIFEGDMQLKNCLTLPGDFEKLTRISHIIFIIISNTYY